MRVESITTPIAGAETYQPDQFGSNASAADASQNKHLALPDYDGISSRTTFGIGEHGGTTTAPGSFACEISQAFS